MEKIELKRILSEQVEKAKDITFENKRLIYNYLGVNYIIEWGKDHNYRFGYHLWFSCNFVKSFSLHRKTHNIGFICIKTDTIDNNNKSIITKINTLKSRIHTQVEMNSFIENSKKEAMQRVTKFVKKDLDESVVINIWSSEDWWNSRQTYPTTKIIRTFNYLNVSVKVKHENINYRYEFQCEFPCKWNTTKLKTIVLKSKTEDYTNKQITNIIRYAKLKNIFANG